MSEPPRDPLAEHPLAPDPPRRRSEPRATLELFPTVSETPFGPPGERPAPTRAEAQIPPGAVPEAAREQLEPAPPMFHEPVLAGGEPDGPRAVAFARRVAAGLDGSWAASAGAAPAGAGSSAGSGEAPSFLGPKGFSETFGKSSRVVCGEDRRRRGSGASGCSASGSRGGSDIVRPASGPEGEVLDEDA